MKNFKLFKRLGAFITALAVLASMGTVAFATTDAPTVAINSVALADTKTKGVYEMTVSYTVANADVGSKGITLLAYGAANDDADLKAGTGGTGDDFTVYDSENYKIAYVLQDTKAPGEDGESYTTVGNHTISFDIDTTKEGAIQVGEENPILILLGGDKVAAPASAIYPQPPAEVKLMDGVNEVTEITDPIVVGNDTMEATVKEALKDAYTLCVDGVEVAWTDVTVTVAKNAEGEKAYKATLTTAQGSTDVDFNITWTADALAISNTSYSIAAADIEGDVTIAKIEDAVKAKVVAETIKVTKTTPALEAVIADAADAITVALKTEGFDGTAANEAVEFVVTLPVGTYGEATVATALTATVTVNYTLESAPDVKYGDVNGDGFILANDVNMAFRASKGKVELTAEQKKAADVASATPDGLILANDVNYIFRASKNKLTNGKFPVEP